MICVTKSKATWFTSFDMFIFPVGNHSCDPNAEVCYPYNNSTLAVKALKPIKPGEVSDIL